MSILSLSLLIVATHLTPLCAQDVEVQDLPATYLPKPYKPAPAPDTSAEVTVNVTIGTNWSSGRLEVSLASVTNWPGAYGNDTETETSPDLVLDIYDNPGWTLVSTSKLKIENITATGSYTVKVKCRDWAASGVFHARLYDSSDMLRDSDSITIPLDADENGIADKWDSQWTAADRAGNGDNETGPGSNAHHGDGYTYWEEYRGFSIKGTVTRLDPTKKDIFTWSEFDGISYWESQAGTSTFPGVSLNIADLGYTHNLPAPFVLHLINPGETRESQGWVNYRNPSHKTRMKQYAVFVDEFTLRTTLDETIKWVKSNTSHPTGEIHGVAQPRSGYSAPNGPAGMKSALVFPIFVLSGTNSHLNPHATDITNNTIAHEFGHNMFLNHSADSADVMYEKSSTQSQFSAGWNGTYNLIAKQLTIGERLGLFLPIPPPPQSEEP